jgi:predicted aconitase with swiveling domain
MNSTIVLHGQSLVRGSACGEVSLLSSPLSLWGGFDLETGRISDVNHPQFGESIAGKILAMPGGRGSSSSSSILLESARMSINPLAVIITVSDPIIAIGALVAADLYGVHIPVILIEPICMDQLTSGQFAEVDARDKAATIALLPA